MATAVEIAEYADWSAPEFEAKTRLAGQNYHFEIRETDVRVGKDDKPRLFLSTAVACGDRSSDFGPTIIRNIPETFTYDRNGKEETAEEEGQRKDLFRLVVRLGGADIPEAIAAMIKGGTVDEVFLVTLGEYLNGSNFIGRVVAGKDKDDDGIPYDRFGRTYPITAIESFNMKPPSGFSCACMGGQTTEF